jgi:hypothetical protein
MKTIIISSQNVVDNGMNDTYRFKFPSAVEFRNDQIALSNISIYYAWFNVNQTMYNNHRFQYRWVDNTVHDVVYPDGAYYTVAQLQTYFYSVMYNNRHYLINNTTGDVLIYLEFVENVTIYGITMTVYAVPTALPTDYQLPAGATWSLPVGSARTPQIVISATNNFGDLIGFSSGTYPPAVQSTNYSESSDYTPNIAPVQSLVVQCSLINNYYSVPNTLLYSFSPNVTLGSLLQIQPSEYSYVDIQDGQYTDFTISFVDQSLNQIEIKDPNIVILLTVRNKYENMPEIPNLKVIR